jgi:hypothetical protein
MEPQTTKIDRYAGDLKQGWPDQLPYVTRAEAQKAVAKLFKKYGRRDDGRKKTRPSYGFNKSWVCLSGPSNQLWKGWRRLVHDVSHDLHRWRYPNKTPHGSFHSTIERELIDYVVGQTNWLQGGLKPKAKAAPSVTDRRQAKLDDARAMLAKWERKLKLAQTKVKGYRRDVLRYERAVATPYVAPTPKPRKKPVRKKLSQREAKRQANELAVAFDIDFDYITNENKYPRMVYPPSGLYTDQNPDPHAGDHVVEYDDWVYILDFVCEYVEAILLKGQDQIDNDAI